MGRHLDIWSAFFAFWIYLQWRIFAKAGFNGALALINLGIASEVGRTLVQASELAANEQLPAKFLEQILQVLRKRG